MKKLFALVFVLLALAVGTVKADGPCTYPQLTACSLACTGFGQSYCTIGENRFRCWNSASSNHVICGYITVVNCTCMDVPAELTTSIPFADPHGPQLVIDDMEEPPAEMEELPVLDTQE